MPSMLLHVVPTAVHQPDQVRYLKPVLRLLVVNVPSLAGLQTRQRGSHPEHSATLVVRAAPQACNIKVVYHTVSIGVAQVRTTNTAARLGSQGTGGGQDLRRVAVAAAGAVRAARAAGAAADGTTCAATAGIAGAAAAASAAWTAAAAAAAAEGAAAASREPVRGSLLAAALALDPSSAVPPPSNSLRLLARTRVKRRSWIVVSGSGHPAQGW